MRRFIYQYKGNNRFEDVEEDLTGTIETPSVGSVITRQGKEWKVVHVIAPVSTNGTVPVVRVFLNDTARIKGHTAGVKHLPK